MFYFISLILGTAISFINEKNRSLAKDVTEILAEANQEIPPWLEAMFNDRGSARGVGGYQRGGRGRGRGGQAFGGRDFRYDNQAARGGAAPRGGNRNDAFYD